MKTLTEKVDALLNEIINLDLRTNIGIDKAKRAIRLALKEQDRDTRHSAAEAFNHICNTADCPQNYEIEAAIMNCDGGLKAD